MRRTLPLNMADYFDHPPPTPPPMEDISVTSYQNLRPRRLLQSTTCEFGRSPLLTRTSTFGTSFSSRCSPLAASSLRRERSVTLLGPRCFSSDLEIDRTSSKYGQDLASNGSKYVGKDNDLTREIEEVKNLSHELQSKFGEYQHLEQSQEQDVYFNDHYISDIDEEEQDQCRSSTSSRGSDFKATLKIHRCLKMPSPILVKRGDFNDSLSSLKSSEFASPVGKKLGFNLEEGGSPKVLKSPCRTVIKIAKIR